MCGSRDFRLLILHGSCKEKYNLFFLTEFNSYRNAWLKIGWMSQSIQKIYMKIIHFSADFHLFLQNIWVFWDIHPISTIFIQFASNIHLLSYNLHPLFIHTFPHGNQIVANWLAAKFTVMVILPICLNQIGQMQKICSPSPPAIPNIRNWIIIVNIGFGYLRLRLCKKKLD